MSWEWGEGQTHMCNIGLLHIVTSKSKTKSYDRQSVSQSCLGVKHPSGAPRLDICYHKSVMAVLMWGAFSDKRTSLLFTIASGLHKRSHSQVQILWGSWPYLNHIRFRTSPTCRARSSYLYSLGTGWPSYTPWHSVPFSLPLTTHWATVKVFESAATQATAHSVITIDSLCSLSTGRIENTSPTSSIVALCSYRMDCVENTASKLLHCCMLRICCLAMDMFAEPLPSNGCVCWLYSSCFNQICHNVKLTTSFSHHFWHSYTCSTFLFQYLSFKSSIELLNFPVWWALSMFK
jgi:hypothetical protein